MLVLSRKVNESIRIGDNVIITVTEITRGKVKIAITAPPELNVRRTEVPDRNAAGKEMK